jgi:hypothetical protein
MTKVVMEPSTMHRAAEELGQVGREASNSARRIEAFATTPGVAPELAAELHAAAAQMHRSAASAEREARFTLTCARHGVLADGLLRARGALALPALLSPWTSAPEPGPHRPRPWWREEPVTGAAAASGAPQAIPGVLPMREPLHAGAAWAAEHPKEFALLRVRRDPDG